jgi:uncharacterized integral membrane protein
MIRKFLAAVVLIPLAVVIVGFAVANRQAVTVSFDPFDAAQPAYAATVPLFILIFVLVILGILIGGTAAWLRQASYRRAARRLERENRALHSELYDLKRHYVASERPALPPASGGAPLTLRSPVD